MHEPIFPTLEKKKISEPDVETEKMEGNKKSKIETIIVDANETNAMKSSPSLDMLNDDSLLHIFECLPNFKDLIAVEKVCKRWQKLSSLAWKKSIYIRPPEADGKLEEILEKYGDRFFNLDVWSETYFNYEIDIFKMINSHCSKLRYLELSLYEFFDTCHLDVKKYPFLKNLKYLHIHECEEQFYESTPVLRDLLKFIPNVSQLEELGLHDCNGRKLIFKDYWKKMVVNYFKFPVKAETDKFFNLFSPAIELKASFWECNYCDKDFSFYDYLVHVSNRVTSIRFVKNDHDSCFRGISYKSLQFSNLKKLVIQESLCVSDDVIFTLVRICPALEILDLYNNGNITDFGFKFLGNLKVIRKLSLRECEITNDTLMFLAESLKTMEELHLPFGPELSDAELINIVELLPNLRFLRLTGFNEFSEATFKLLKEKVMERLANKSLEIEFVDGTPDEAEEINLKKEKNFSLEPEGLVVTVVSVDDDDVKIFDDWESRLHFYDSKFPHTRKNNAKYYRYFTVE